MSLLIEASNEKDRSREAGYGLGQGPRRSIWMTGAKRRAIQSGSHPLPARVSEEN
jgi:hypothetical protein